MYTIIDGLNSWDAVKSYLKKLSLSGKWIFRGQADSGWGLLTSMDRFAEKENIGKMKKGPFEQALLYDLKGSIGLHNQNNVVDKENDLDMIGLMQHYGAPSRLLDFTRSPYVAAFFSLVDGKEKSAIFALDYGHLSQSYLSILNDYKNEMEAENELKRLSIDITDKNVFKSWFMNNTKYPLVAMVRPSQLNDRIFQQDGCFLCQGNIELTFEENLDSFFSKQVLINHKPFQVIKILLNNSSIREDAMNDFNMMNIGYHTLFPGLEGHIRSMAMRVKFRSNLF